MPICFEQRLYARHRLSRPGEITASRMTIDGIMLPYYQPQLPVWRSRRLTVV
ncbi:hypothetical protein KCP77_14760 [Salmonella enterica subsp. enterica]|nr:hypothetical protein KCP77_14760 [Salmonella enterica subsp. enterica]